MPAKAKKTRTNYATQSYLRTYCNLVPDPIDPRDYQFGPAGAPSWLPRVPRRVDYSAQTKPVGDQGQTGSCVGWAAAYGLRRWLHREQTGRKLNFSVRFVWMGSKEYDPFDLNVPFDLSGTRIRDAFKVMRKFGACTDKSWKFEKLLPDATKEEAIKTEALRYRIARYHQLTTNGARRLHLAKEGPFVMGVPVYSNWATIGSDGLVPDPGGVFGGGHAILVVGYDDTNELFKFQNSWGTGWGRQGFGFLTYDYVETHSWSSWGADRL